MEERCLRVLLIEDDEDDYIITRELLAETEDVRFHLEWASTYETGLSKLLGQSYDTCLLDFRLGERSGLELLQEAKDAGCDIPIILLTGQGGFRIDLEAMKAGASDYLDKDEIGPRMLERTLRYAVERHRLQRSLKTSENRLQTIVKNTLDGIVITDTAGVVQFVNPAAEALFAGNPDCLPDRCFPFPLAPGTSSEILVKADDSSPVIAEIRVAAIVWEGQNAYLASLRNITARKQAEENVRHSEERLRRIIEAMPIMLDAFDGNRRIVAWNGECERLTGYSSEEIINKPEAMELLYPDKTYREKMMVEWAERGSDFYDWEWDIRTKNGKTKTVAWSNISDRFSIPGWDSWAVGVDVTARKLSEKALEESRRQMAELFNFLPDATFAIDRFGRVIAWNRAIEEMTGIAASDMLGRGDRAYSIPFYGKPKPILIDLVLEPEEAIEAEYRMICREQNMLIGETINPLSVNGRSAYLWGKAAPIYDANGELVGAIESIRDVTQYRISQEALRESEERFSTFMDYFPAAAFMKDGNSRLIYTNKYCLDMFGIEPAPDGERRNPLPESVIERHREDDLKAISGQVIKIMETLSDLNGVPRVYRTFKFPVSRKGKPTLLGGISVEITEQVNMQKALAVSEEKFRSIFAESPIGLMLFDAQGRFLEANRSALKIFGVASPSSFTSFNLFNESFMPAESKERLHQGYSVHFEDIEVDFDMIRQKAVFDSIYTGVRDLSIILTPIGKSTQESFNGFLSQIQDFSRRKRAEAQIHTLTHRLIQAQENERKRISRYLHDSVAQDLSSLKIGCDMISDVFPDTPGEIRSKLTELSNGLKRSIHLIRGVSYDLHPAALDKLGLVRALNQYCQDFSQQTGIAVDFLPVGINGLNLDFDTEINLYRVVQEALNNIRKHAEARTVSIRIVASFPNLILRIEDDGNGFDVTRRLTAALDEKRMGLRSMQERVGLLNGKFQIQSRPRQGTKIVIEVPCSDRCSLKEQSAG